MKKFYTKELLKIIDFSHEELGRLQNITLEPDHLMLGILRHRNCSAVRTLCDMGVDTKQLKTNLDNILMTKDQIVPNQIASNYDSDREVIIDPRTKDILKMSILESKLSGDELADSNHLLLAILRDKYNDVADILGKQKIDYNNVMSFIKTSNGDDSLNSAEEIEPIAGNNFTDDEDESKGFYDEKPKGGNADRAEAKNEITDSLTPVLDNFGFDITKAASEDKLDPIVGRDLEVERIAQILSRRKKNNPILIGEPGVGKSAIVEGLAMRIIEKKVPRSLLDKRLVSLDLALVVAGTKYRGQFEERIKAIINELKKNPDVIIFIDEIHTMVGAGNAGGSMDAANMLKPALARGEIQCIGATTLDEYRKNIEKDGALERRFQKIIVNATTAEETLQILRNIKDRYEDHHNVKYTDEALQACVKLSDRYITDRNFPDKAIDAMDEAGSRMNISNVKIPQEIQDIEEKLTEAINNKMRAVKEQKYELAASFRDEQRIQTQLLMAAEEKWKVSLKKNRQEVTTEKVEEVVSIMSGVPLQKIGQIEGVKLTNMKQTLKAKIIGQDKAVDTIVKAIQRNRLGLKNPNKPIGTFMFLGPTGVGKTHLAKKIAEELFDSEDALIRIDMSEYMEKFNVSRLVGAPPGYVGYEEGGLMTEKVRRKPYSVILLDEIEKAHPDVFNLLLQVLDEGHLTDSQGRKVDFKNTIIIMTSNAGTRQLKDFGKGVGFAMTHKIADIEHSRSILMKALNKSFSPEFLNRLDDIVIFDQLGKDSIRNIVDIELVGFFERMKELGYNVEPLTEEQKDFLVEKGYDIQYGARPLKRAIQTYIEDELAEEVLNGNIIANSAISFEIDKENEKLKVVSK